MTNNLEDGEQLYIGLKPIEYVNYEDNDNFITTQEEMEAALATAPNGALFGSSYYRTHLPYSLWIFNWCEGSNNMFKKWLNKSFGKAPVLMNNVNPELRVSVAKSVLQNHGYFRGDIDYSIINGKPKTTKTDTVPRPRTAKIAYTVNMGPLSYIDSVDFTNFPPDLLKIIKPSQTLLKSNTPFNISTLDNERTRIYKELRNQGYYYANQAYVSYLADTLQTADKVQLRVNLADSLPAEAYMKWVVGSVNMNLRRQLTEVLTDSMQRRILTVHFSGKRPPIRPRVLLQDMKIRPGDLFSQSAYEESVNQLSTKGIYSSIGLELKPILNPDGSYKLFDTSKNKLTRDGQDRTGAGMLDMSVNCILDKPYDFSVEANYIGKTSGRMGPGLGIGFAKRNAFRGGEVLGVNLKGNYEFQTGEDADISSNNYEISADLTLTLPRLLLPNNWKIQRRRWHSTPSTALSIARETINRSGFFRRHILSGQIQYTLQPNKQIIHQFTPLMVEYDFMADASDDYLEKASKSAYLLASTESYFMTKMRYTFRYTSPTNYLNPIYLTASITESSNLLALGYMVGSRSWNENGKTAFHAPFAQFIKLEADWRKTWRTSEYNTLVAHTQIGWLKSFGNSTSAPFSEYFYVGGANSIRAFSARAIGPGRSYLSDGDMAYLNNNGGMKFVGNIEYRPRLFGSLYGAVFLDFGNIWDNEQNADVYDNMDYDNADEDMKQFIHEHRYSSFKIGRFASDLAVGAGLGIRYDLDFFVLRLDWGIVIHDPRSNSGSGYFNTPKFSKAYCFNFAIGYPF